MQVQLVYVQVIRANKLTIIYSTWDGEERFISSDVKFTQTC